LLLTPGSHRNYVTLIFYVEGFAAQNKKSQKIPFCAEDKQNVTDCEEIAKIRKKLKIIKFLTFLTGTEKDFIQLAKN
jgi:hypothetical protein